MSFSIYSVPNTPWNETERSAAVARSGALEIANSPALDAITTEARRRLGAAMAIVTIVHQDWVYVIAASGFLPGVYRRSTSFCGHAILTPTEPFVVPDASMDERFAGNPNVEEVGGIRFYAAVALTDDGGLPLGTLCVLDQQPRAPLTREETDSLRLLSSAAMAHLAAQAAKAEPATEG